MNSLSEQILKLRKEISTDSYSMSIGELINLYVDKEIDIHPKFQRLFRWEEYQKTSFIESIMLNIPIPPIFVSQNKDGIWDVVDGVQRISTILQFVGKLQDENGNFVKLLVLEKTKQLSEFEGVQWENKNNPEKSFSKDLQLDFKRAKIVVNIVKKESDTSTKYELFQRLNTGGTQLSEQEVRNCLMIMTNSTFYDFVYNLAEDSQFVKITPISDRKTDEQFRMELVTRYLIAMQCVTTTMKKDFTDLSPLLNDKIIELSSNVNFDFETTKTRFYGTINLLCEVMDDPENVFKKYSIDKFSGPFLSSAYQAITIGVTKNFNDINNLGDNKKDWLVNKIKEMHTKPDFSDFTKNGVRAVDRFVALTQFGEAYFKP